MRVSYPKWLGKIDHLGIDGIAFVIVSNVLNFIIKPIILGFGTDEDFRRPDNTRIRFNLTFTGVE